MPKVSYLTPDEFARRNPSLGSAVVVRNRVRQGRLPHVRLGRRILIPSDAFARLERGTAFREPISEAEPQEPLTEHHAPGGAM